MIKVIYHGNCFDGFTAAWAVKKWHDKALTLTPHHIKDIEFIPGVFGQDPPNVEGDHVYIVDFSYPRAVLEKMLDSCAAMTILDHHKTAKADLEGLRHPKLHVVFDMERSGAGIAWDFFNGENTRPAFVDYVEDRDLWRFALPDSRMVHAAVSSYPMDFETWDKLADTSIPVLATIGRDIERKHLQDVASLLPVVQREMVIGGIKMPVANMPMTMTSDAGNRMAGTDGVAACYWDTPVNRVFSLRSGPNGPDVSAIAAMYGGGGHAHASGFQVAYDRLQIEGLL